MVEDMVELEFESFAGSVEGIKCPSCGTKYLFENTVMDKVVKAEEAERYK